MAQEQCLQPKMKFLLGYNIKIAIQWGEYFLGWWQTNSPNPISVGIIALSDRVLENKSTALKKFSGELPLGRTMFKGTGMY